MPNLVQSMADAAAAFLEVLPAERALEAGRLFEDDDERRNWHYTPRPRAGAALGKLEPKAHKLAHRLLATGLSLPAYAKATAIIALEDLLDEVEGGGLRRSPAWYFVTVFGTPGEPRWGWRFEGHHISLNWTVVDGSASATPLFLGANPAVWRSGGRDATRPLRQEEEAARDLLASLDDDQRAVAVLSRRAPSEILTGNERELTRSLRPGDVEGLSWEPMDEADNEALEYSAAPKGIASSNLDARQRGLLAELVEAYLGRAPAEAADAERARLDLTGLHFAWAGSPDPGRPHYYRVQSAGFLAEYDNWQNDANHIHAVWRSPERDFGRDLLAAHHAGHTEG